MEIIFANILHGLATVLKMVLDLYLIILIARVVLTWVNADPYNPIVRFLSAATDPVIYWFRRRLPLTFGNVDFSPILVFALIFFVQAAVVQTLFDYSTKIKHKAMYQQKVMIESDSKIENQAEPVTEQ